jgi:hypothetical protein
MSVAGIATIPAAAASLLNEQKTTDAAFRRMELLWDPRWEKT